MPAWLHDNDVTVSVSCSISYKFIARSNVIKSQSEARLDSDRGDGSCDGGSSVSSGETWNTRVLHYSAHAVIRFRFVVHLQKSTEPEWVSFGKRLAGKLEQRRDCTGSYQWRWRHRTPGSFFRAFDVRVAKVIAAWKILELRRTPSTFGTRSSCCYWTDVLMLQMMNVKSFGHWSAILPVYPFPVGFPYRSEFCFRNGVYATRGVARNLIWGYTFKLVITISKHNILMSQVHVNKTVADFGVYIPIYPRR